MEYNHKLLLAMFGGYHGKDLTKINRYITRNYGTWFRVFHENTSEYIHTDLYPIPPGEGREYYTLVSLGMGTEDMFVDDKGKAAIELVLYLSKEPDERSSELHFANFLTNLTKFPFREETYFDEGHTFEFSDSDKELFPYDGFAFRQSRTRAGRADARVYLPGIERTVRFLDLVPVYKDEFDLIRQNAAAFFEWIDKEFGKQWRFADLKRNKHFTENNL